MPPEMLSSFAYNVTTPVFEGPLDLLLQLIEKTELDITKLALAQVTDQFLDYLHKMPENSASDVSSFLVIASKLVQIKSEALLPRPPIREPGEIDPGDALAKQLIIYKKFKEIAGFLSSRQELYRTFPRDAPAPKIDAVLDLRGLTVEDLYLMAQFFLEREEILPSLNSVVSAPIYTIREKIQGIADYLRKHRSCTFNQLLSSSPPRLEIVVTFLALLELVKRNMIFAQQENLFGDITFEPSTDWQDDLAFELEFGE
jgi:segregation and condensation protein A